MNLTTTKTAFICEPFTERAVSLLEYFGGMFQTYTLEYDHRNKRYVKKPDKKFFFRIPLENLFFFGIHSLSLFFSLAKEKGFKVTDFTFKTLKGTPSKQGLEFNAWMKPRSYQTTFINALVKDSVDPFNLVDLQTGKGKTFIALLAAVKIGHRIGVVLPRWIDKWISDFKAHTNLESKKIFVVKGSKSLQELGELVKNDTLEFDVIIFSNRTLLNYLKGYLTNPLSSEYSIRPDKLFNTFGIGTLIIDEVHKEFHANFILSMLSNVEKVIALSATLVTYDPKLQEMHELMFAKGQRLSFLDLDKYTVFKTVCYKFERPDDVISTYKNRTTYSHGAFEDYLCKRHSMLEGYMSLILKTFNDNYIKRRETGEKCVVFFYTVKMCEVVQSRLAREYKSLDVLKYTHGDPYSNALESDVVVSTLESAGTAVDITGLITVIQTVNTLSPQANIQVLGRLRKYAKKEVLFVQLWAENIAKHKEYHNKRIELFATRVKKWIKTDSGFSF